ncbi:fibronectin type III-like domain-contianing protein [Nigerium massiliense]|uniref:fibronectin type III-like domain-contianing protein n=1 Tax=Nigerium massiliense TaxID=1522317 RepID=UPI001C468171|nr:fibronectin type III-like domain-contianing protein [Nigerium massiliense]
MTLEPGESKKVTITVDPNATNHPLSAWSYAERGFAVPTGEFAVFAGNSSDAPQIGTLTVR